MPNWLQVNDKKTVAVTVIIDDNKLQAMDFTDEVICGDLSKKFEGFGVKPMTINGHDMWYLEELLPYKHLSENPTVFICETIKGKGFPAMENVPKFHFRLPGKKEMGEYKNGGEFIF